MAKAPVLPRGFELPLEPRLPRVGSVDAVAVEERAATLAKGRLITRDDLRIEFTPGATGELGVRPSLAEVETQYIRRILDEVRGDKRAAARILGISVRTLQRMQANMVRVGPGLTEPQA